tara:strand:+ start:137 stop:1312 length:1176 start_codon:yes stop_codon:yes gene_type:complete
MIKNIFLIICFISLSIPKNNNLQDSLNQFGINLFKVVSNNTHKSAMISPWSISNSLMMVSQGASNNTYDEILKTLNLDQDQLNNFTNPYNPIDSVLLVSNSIWIQSDNCYNPNSTYIDILQNKFSGKISYVNFHNDRELVIQDINSWVETVTKGTIKKIVSDNDIKKSTTQALLNTIYFKSNWLYPFDQNKTIKSKFYVNFDTIQIDMMNKKNKYAYYNSDTYQLLELPYDNNVSMYLYLPNIDIELENFINEFTIEKFDLSRNELKYDLGKIYIPKLNLSYSSNLKDHLPKLGIISAFNPNSAEFDRFWDYKNTCKKYPPKHYIDLINHKSFISMTESGTEASAATIVIINRVTSIRPNEHFTFNANHPFMYIIYDKLNDNILFIGKYKG